MPSISSCLRDFAKMFPPGSLAREILEWQLKEAITVDEKRENVKYPR